MSMIKIENLTFSYPSSSDNIFENVSFQIDTDWKLGFVGRNGRGKTTFLNLLQNKYEYSGKILSSVSFDYFPCPVTKKERLTEEILWDIAPLAEEWEFLKAYLKKKKGFLLVSHDRCFLDNCVDHILSLNRTNIEIQSGNFSSWMENFKRQQDFETSQNERLKKDIFHLRQAAQRTSAWSVRTETAKYGNGPVDRGYIGHKSAKMMKRAKTIEARQKQAIEEKSGLLKNAEYTENLKLFPQKYHTDTLASFSHICICYDRKPVCGPLSFSVQQGDRLVLHGKNGSGKSSLGKACAKLLGKRFVDMDDVLVERIGGPISSILSPGNETPFRNLESAVAAELGKENGQVIATGGGAVLRAQNVRALRQNGVVVYIDRPLGQLAVGGARPLSQSAEALAAMHAARAPLYAAACDARVENDGPFESVAEAIKERFYEILDH